MRIVQTSYSLLLQLLLFAVVGFYSYTASGQELPKVGGGAMPVIGSVTATPGSQISGYDWQEQWVVSGSSCTKNSQEGYEATLWISNEGDESYTVENLAVRDDPDGIYQIVDPGNIQPGAEIKAGVKEEFRILFKPTEEKYYGSRIRLTFSIHGVIDSVDSFLDGIGVESSVGIDDVEFTVNPSDNPQQTRELVDIRSTGTRPLIITYITLTGTDSADFSFVGGPPALPLVILPGKKQTLEISFHPSGTSSSERRAQLNVQGDFAYADCLPERSDSSAELIGRIGTLSVDGEESVAGYGIRSVMPNPFSHKVEVRFALREAGETSVALYTVSGVLLRELLREKLNSGEQNLKLDLDIPSGVYYLHITSGNWSESRKVWSVK